MGWIGSAGAGRQTGAAAWERRKAAYAYAADRPPAVTEERRPDPEHPLSRLLFTRPNGHSFAGLLIRPAAGGPFPCALLLHALSSDKEAMIEWFGRPLAARGVAALALDAHLHGERKPPTAAPLAPLEYLDLARESVVEYRQALDHLVTRLEIDPERIGLLGYSLGAMMGAILAGVDERVKAAVLMVGGDMVRTRLPPLPAFLQERVDVVSPANFVAHISPRPVLFLNGTGDSTVPRDAATALHEAAREPKEIRWVDAGHHLPPEAAAEGVEWLIARLAPRYSFP